MKTKYYFEALDSELCYTLDYHLDQAREQGLSRIELYEAVPEKVNGFFFCRAVNAVGEDGYCGSQCTDYEPRNGKSGMCRHRSNTMYEHGEKVTFTVK